MTYTLEQLLALGEFPTDALRVLAREKSALADDDETDPASVPVADDQPPTDKL